MDDLIGKEFRYVKSEGEKILLHNGTVLDTIGKTYKKEDGTHNVVSFTMGNGTVRSVEDVCYLWFADENPADNASIFTLLLGNDKGSIAYHQYIVREECKSMEKESK